MAEENQNFEIHRVQKRLDLFFPDASLSEENIESGLDAKDIFYKPNDILPYLHTALLDEKIMEVEIDGLTRVYFSRLIDEVPDPVEEEVDGEVVLTEPEYSPGEYLNRATHIITLPIEPGIGNLYIRYSKRLLLRIFTSSFAVEFGTVFDELTSVRGLPVLRLAFPTIGRIVRGAREYRAKVPQKMDLTLTVSGKSRKSAIKTRLVDVCASGMSFSLEKEQQELFTINEVRTFEIFLGEESAVKLKGNIRHMAKVRKHQGIEYICGVQFDLATRELAAKVESVFAAVQRAHLKELSELSDDSGYNLIA